MLEYFHLLGHTSRAQAIPYRSIPDLPAIDFAGDNSGPKPLLIGRTALRCPIDQ